MSYLNQYLSAPQTPTDIASDVESWLGTSATPEKIALMQDKAVKLMTEGHDRQQAIAIAGTTLTFSKLETVNLTDKPYPVPKAEVDDMMRNLVV